MSDSVDYDGDDIGDDINFELNKTIIGCTETLTVQIEESFTLDVKEISPLIDDILALVENDIVIYPHTPQVLKNVNILVALPKPETKHFCRLVRVLHDYMEMYKKVTVTINLFPVESVIKLGVKCVMKLVNVVQL